MPGAGHDGGHPGPPGAPLAPPGPGSAPPRPGMMPPMPGYPGPGNDSDNDSDDDNEFTLIHMYIFGKHITPTRFYEVNLKEPKFNKFVSTK